MDIIHYLLNKDHEILLFINGLNCPFMDSVMWQISSRIIWVPLYLVIIYFIFKERGKYIWVTIIALAFMILISDQLSVFVKDTVQRYRPTHNPVLATLIHIVNDYRGGDYGFVSSHASNSFAVATFTSLFFCKRWITISLFIWATVICYSRMYLGVHYPLDILGGAVIGIFAGSLIYYLEKFVIKRLAHNNKTKA